ncbi:MAG TPA: glycogen/starch synthase [Longilinea sp.]|nr:glycogen/starch synthase [Longilinea sp.]
MSPVSQTPTINVLFIASEADPLVKVGGLGDVAGSLPRALRALPSDQTGGYKLDVRLALPFYPTIDVEKWRPSLLAQFEISYPGNHPAVEVYSINLEGIPTYLVKSRPIDEEQNVYPNGSGKNGDKFILFSLATLEMVKALDWKPDILHANDWHTALAVYELAHKRTSDVFYNDIASVLTLHNLPFMGAGTEKALESYGIPPSQDVALPEWARSVPLPMGLSVADRIVAVSPTYAKEITTSDFGCDLQDFLCTRTSRIKGILNGVDTRVWNAEKDPNIPAPFSTSTLENKKIDKQTLQAEFGLEANPDIPLLILVSRMDRQKGVDIAIEGLRQANELTWQAILLGTGDPTLESACQHLQQELPDKVRAVMRFDSALSHRLYAGADIIMMPSRYEPCGLSQLIAMRYGTIPLAHAIGGLADTIKDVSLPNPTGFLFSDLTPQSFANGLHRCFNEYQQKTTWAMLQKNAMQQDFSWKQSALEYAAIYRELKET